MKCYPFCFLLFAMLSGWSQNPVRCISFLPTFQQQPLELGVKYYSRKHQDSIEITRLKFYVSDLTLLHKGVPVYQHTTRHHLVDMESESNPCIPVLFDEDFDEFSFYLGVDSITNVSGAHGGHLDPTNGMYWTWQSGYINFKLEGKTALCPARNHLFQFHLGGYQKPFMTQQRISLKTGNNQRIQVLLPIDQFLETIDLREIYEVMSPGERAVTLSAIIARLFTLKDEK